jgi:hypothetical protein
MSRTIRRKSKWIEEKHRGTWEEFQVDPYLASFRCNKGKTIRKVWEESLAALHGDSHSGHYNAPRWYRKIFSKKHNRCVERILLRTCTDFEEHVTSINKSNAQWYWW